MARDELNTVDAFLSHRANERSGGFLEKWKTKRTPPVIDVFLHTRRMPYPIWRHGFFKLMPREKNGATVVEVWGDNLNCREDETVLRKQYHRDRDTGRREVPPVKCPFCRLIEVIRDMVDEGQLDWTTPIFRFEGDEDVSLIHAGGIYNAYSDDDLTPEDKKGLREAGIDLREAWKENGMAKLSYLFCVVDVKNPGGGVQLTIEPSLLGDKVKGVINDTMKSLGSERGNPFLSPYAIQWEYLPAEPEFNKKYAARRMELIPCTPAILKLITGEPPSLNKVTAPLNIATTRALFERHCLVKNIPWDHIFGVQTDESEEEQSEEFPPQQEQHAQSVLPSVAAGAPEEDVCPECGPGKDCPHVACDKCDRPILQTDPVCKHCGHVYNAQAAAAQPPPPPAAAGRRRGREGGSKLPI